MDEDDFDLTQPMSLGYDDEDPAAEANDVAMLKVLLQNGIPKELEFSLREGINKIGRNESCEICIKNKVLSKEHAVIEVGGDWFLICDLNSSNKTWKGKKPLKPNVKYKLEPNDEIMFGSIKTQFIVKKQEDAEGGDSGSETGSESMLLLNEEYCAFSVSTPIKNEGGNSSSHNGPASDSSFSKTMGAVEVKNKALQEASLDLENAPTQEYNGNLSDSGDETDCENHSEDKPVIKKSILQSGDKAGPDCEVKTLGTEASTDNSNDVIKTVGHERKTPEKAPDMVQGSENVITDQISERNFFNTHEQLPESCSLESNEDLPPTQINLALKNHTAVDNSRHIMNIDKCMNSADKVKHYDSFDSLPETQLNTRNYNENQEFSEISRTKTNRGNLSRVVFGLGKVDNNTDNLNNNHEGKVLESDDETKSSDDLPPTQLNCALQFSQEDNILQEDDSYCLFNQNSSLSPRPSTSSGAGYFRKSAGSIHSLGSSHKKLNIESSKILPEGNDKDNSATNKDTKMALFSCINISVDEGSDAVLCPATQRRSDNYNSKIKNTDVQSSPVLGSSSDKKKENVAETPPHLLQESTMTNEYSSAVISLSKQLLEVSAALNNTGTPSTSRADEKTSDNLHTPGSHGEPSVKPSTPDSAKAGESNYSGNYSPKVYKTKLNNLDENSQETLPPGEVAAELSHLKASNKMSGTLAPTAEATDDDIRGDSDKSKKRGKRGRKPRAAKKSDDHKTKEHSNAADKRSLPDSNTGSKTKKAKNNESVADSGVLNLSVNQHDRETGDQEQRGKFSAFPHTKIKKTGGNKSVTDFGVLNFAVDKHSPDNCDDAEDDQDKVNRTSQRRKSKRLVPTNSAKSEVPQKNKKSADSFSPLESHAEKENLEESLAPSVSTRSSRSSLNKNSAEKKKHRNEPAKKSKRQKVGSSEATENKQNDIEESMPSELVDESSDFASAPQRKSARRKLLPSELDCTDPDYNPEVGFSAFRRIEASEAGKDNLVGFRALMGRKAALTKDSSSVNGSISKLTQLGINESEVSVSKSGEQCNITLEKDGSAVVQHLKCDVGDEEKASILDQSDDIKKKVSPIVVKLNIFPTAQRRGRKKGKTRTDKTEMQIDSGSETVDSNDKSSSTEKEVKDTTLAKLTDSCSDKRQVSEPRRSRRKKKSPVEPDGESVSSASEVSVDENPAKLGKCQISVFAKDSVESLIKLKDVGPSLKDSKSPEIIQCSRGKKTTSEIEDKSAIAVPEIKKGRQSRLKRDSKVDTASPAKSKRNQNPDSSSAWDGISEKEANRAKNKRVKVDKEEDKNETSVSKVKTGRLSRSKLTTDDSSTPPKSKRQHNSGSSSVSNNICEIDVNLTKNKKAKLSEEEEEEENISAVPEAKSDQKSRSKLKSKDGVGSSPKSKCHQSSSSVSDSVSEKEITPAKNRKTTAKDKCVTFTSPSPRHQPQTLKPKVMFTMIEDEEPQKVVTNLGGRVVEDVNLCTHLVADKLRRTVKALCCVAKGIPLVSTKWIQECKKSESFVDYFPYLIKDKAAEKQYGFELQKTLQKASDKPLLTSWGIHVTPKVVPSPEQMKDIIQCAGGKYLPKMPNRLSEKTVVIACTADLNLCSHAAKCGIPIVGSEFILTGLLQYKIDTKSYMLNKK